MRQTPAWIRSGRAQMAGLLVCLLMPALVTPIAAHPPSPPVVRPIPAWLVAFPVRGVPTVPPVSPYWGETRLQWSRHCSDSHGELRITPPATSRLCRCYAYAEIFIPAATDITLQVHSSGTVELWLNRQRLYWRNFSLAGGADLINCRLAPGYNSLLVVLDGAAPLRFGCVVRDPPTELQVITPLVGEALLEEIGKRTLRYFLQATDPGTGLTRDSYPLEPGAAPTSPASIAASGFYLSSLCIAAENGWLPLSDALHRARTTIRTFLEKVDGTNGFYYHFVDPASGRRVWESEISSIDTALLLAGALTARNYFRDEELTAAVNELYRRIRWRWMLNGGTLLSMGWKPESGFLPHRWDSYSEHMLLYLLAVGAPQDALDPDTWYRWKRPLYTYGKRTYVQAVPLFQHQYTHCWVDFRSRRDAIADYFLNSRLATLAHRDYCLSLKDRFPAFSPRLWGVTASLGPRGYMVWGGPPPTQEYPLDGTVVPCAAGGSLPFATDECLPVLEEIANHYPEAWTPLGFADAFNPLTSWRAPAALSIDQGAILLMTENARSARVWDWFMQSPEVRDALRAVGFCRYGTVLQPADREYLRVLAQRTWECIRHFTAPETGLPYDTSDRTPYTSASNIGLYLASLAAARDMGFLAPSEALSRARKVLDSLEAMETWHGFRQCWHSVVDLTPSPHDTMISLVDSANLAMGALVAAAAFEPLRPRFLALVDAMDWTAFYDPDRGLLHGGYDTARGAFPTNWYVDLLASDARSAAFLAIALGGVPADVWKNLQRPVRQECHTDFYGPGREGGGLFMQYLPGIFIPERNTVLARSAANLAYCDIIHARRIGAPVWGWSSCAAPDGSYLGWGHLSDEVVSPHACVLAVEDFAPEVFANLLRLGRLGAAADWVEGTNRHAFGFRDSINWKTGQVADKYLMLDQCMLFLSLANYLENGLIRRYFTADERVAHAVDLLPELSRRFDRESISVFVTEADLVIRQGPRKRSLQVPALAVPPRIDGDLSDWPPASTSELGRISLTFPADSESGRPLYPRRFAADIRVGWDTGYLYLAVSVADDELVCSLPPAELYRGDCLEVFLDPQCDGFRWGSPRDFQIGLSPSGAENRPQAYAWFQKTVPEGLRCAARLKPAGRGPASYELEAALPWSFLGLDNIAAGRRVCASFAVHTMDRGGKHEAKLNWSYVPQPDHVDLGILELISGSGTAP